MNLYLLRHGLAVDLGEHGINRDADRPLTAKGKAKLGKIATAMQAIDLSFDLILSSPYLRARQTAEIFADSFNARKRVELSEALTPGGSSRKLVELIKRLGPFS